MLAERIIARERGPANRSPRMETAEKFASVWRDKRYRGFGNGTSGQDETPLLRALVSHFDRTRGAVRLPSQCGGNRIGPPIRIIEGGPGSGDHTIALAKEGLYVTAVEFAEDAAAEIREKARRGGEGYGLRVKVVNADLLRFLRESKLRPDAFYANSVLHFFSSRDRTVIYLQLSRRETEVIAVSFKAEGDALQTRGNQVGETRAGVIVRGDDEIDRLFVRDVIPLINEVTSVGYAIDPGNIHTWDVPDYNIPGEPGRFVGFLAVRER